ncbi:MAG: hypoxanthine phosphoribosyltransferase [Planctomycetes bacterium]|nr:hypoxanthine phosphoribosyltransferase [Planctomycetota bacterium]
MQFEILIPRADLERRARELATAIAPPADGAPPVVVAVLEGARPFADLLCRHLPGRPSWQGIRASSYGDGTVSRGAVAVQGEEQLEVRGRTVLLVEDIVDTGRTVQRIRESLFARGAVAVQVATLLSKPARRVVPVVLEHVGFEVPDAFVIGFGMDAAGCYRDLPYVAIHPTEGGSRSA